MVADKRLKDVEAENMLLAKYSNIYTGGDL